VRPVRLHRLNMQVVAVRLDWGGIEWAAVGLRELNTWVVAAGLNLDRSEQAVAILCEVEVKPVA